MKNKSDFRLREHLANEFWTEQNTRLKAEGNGYQMPDAFSLGWDAARTNESVERNALYAELIGQEHRLGTRAEILEKERDQLRAAAEKLAEALESIKQTIETNANDVLWCHDEVNMTVVEKIDINLAEYREKFPKQPK